MAAHADVRGGGRPDPERDGSVAAPGGWEAIRRWDVPPSAPPPAPTAHLRWQPGGGHHGGTTMSGLLAAVDEREDFVRYPPVKCPRLSRWAGLGYGQAQIGENFLLMAQYDKADAMRRVLAPVPSPGVARGATLCAGLAFVVVFAHLAAAAMGSVPPSDIWTPAVFIGLFFFFCCGTISVLPDPGVSVNFRMLDDGITALHVAAQHGSMSAARMLVAEGAALDIGDVDGRTPLHHAATHMQDELAKFLLARGANTNAEDAWGKTPYQLVPERGGHLWVTLGGPETTYVYDPDNDSVPGRSAESAAGKQDSATRRTAADAFLEELDRLAASPPSQPENMQHSKEDQDQSYGFSERLRGGSADLTDKDTVGDDANHDGQCETAAGVVCAAESLLIRPTAAAEVGSGSELSTACGADGDDPVPEDENCGDSGEDGRGIGLGSISSSSSSSHASSSDDELNFELEEPPVEAVRPSVFSSVGSSSASQPGVVGVEVPAGYTAGGSIGPLAAAASGALDLLQQQYARDPNSLRRCDLSGRSCMVTALENGHIEVVEWLCYLPGDSSVNSRKSAAHSTAMDIRSWLIEEGGIDSLRPLHHAILRREPRAVEALLQAGADTETRTRLSSRYTNGSIDGGVERVTKTGDRETLSDEDKTALLLAVTVACHQATLAASSEATAGPSFLPARTMQETRSSRKIIRLLLEFGADIHARDQELYTSLHIAQEANVLPLLELLLEHGAATDFDEPVEGAVVEASLCWAARQRNVDQVKMLLRHGALVNALGRGGMTPLHFAARAGSLEIACLLLDAGADPAITWRGKTPEELARSNKRDDVAALLHSAVRLGD